MTKTIYMPPLHYRGLRDFEMVEGFVIAVDTKGDGYLLQRPLDIDPSFFADGPLIHNIPMVGMTQQPGVYQVEAYFQVIKGYVHGTRQKWADECEWVITSYWHYSKPIERPF